MAILHFGGRKFFNHMNQRGFANMVLVVVIVILVGAVGYFMFVKKFEPGSQQPTPTPTQTNTAVSPTPTPQSETAQWKIFTNTEYKYRINYPPDWELGQITVKQSPAAVRFTKITKQGDKYLNDAVVDVIVEPNPLRKTPTEEWYREWVKQIPTGINLEGVKFEETTFKNMKALKIDNNTVFFAKGLNMFEIKWHVAGDYNQSLAESAEKIFEQMMATFEFID
ncbi:MAG: hypothetical protein A3C80_04560 [Candidatus Ryanbacteria bacterium RIFCSPHIGHO2_02_FULL_45_43]|uniref:PsbP C-terminal domain-containing protein n=1 Tax=Candidatus Ryanbacteria bacterium RIFCSPHIGHO2_01_45_13 TaxID=1802112 RepID=A0A1G2G023_9BACT|nr:MAG: hypothetical protein A2W41_04950 [Candidatus Ryanbacteria bacterium RIFCSPHIGHO2_01_45_13]OGZ49143.1 MAG: hypothetical protein A3C80_04560 [Candidatus Ryanbacteria bacterium RIFCSPHIGHO2_02_FULL_45_43]OGZ50925.1 MAG: hypothetical protein A3E55_00635 [Candidatus Ryanbacteria bacterium RIFCSPHIGHO2_12_FULL_44_20]OGZ51403.1 MAG: hypothetical protein A3A17_00260 [Candidatus Ryanbacteria bacterium RIFCSPLOWO2_01_FULL_44_230]